MELTIKQLIVIGMCFFVLGVEAMLFLQTSESTGAYMRGYEQAKVNYGIISAPGQPNLLLNTCNNFTMNITNITRK